MTGWKNCITSVIEGAGQRFFSMKTWKEVVEKDMDDLHIKLSDAMNCREWREIIGGIGPTVTVIVMLWVE